MPNVTPQGSSPSLERQKFITSTDIPGQVGIVVLNPDGSEISAGGGGGGGATRGTFSDGSGTITVGGTSQQIFATNLTRNYLLIQNISSGNLYVNFTNAAKVDTPGSLTINPHGSLEMIAAGFISDEAVNIIGATTGQAFTAKQSG